MADQIVLKANGREALGTRVSRRFRSGGKVPCVLLNKREKPLHLLDTPRGHADQARPAMLMARADHRLSR